MWSIFPGASAARATDAFPAGLAPAGSAPVASSEAAAAQASAPAAAPRSRHCGSPSTSFARSVPPERSITARQTAGAPYPARPRLPRLPRRPRRCRAAGPAPVPGPGARGPVPSRAELARPGPLGPEPVSGVGEGAPVDRQAAAADAPRQAVPQLDQPVDPVVEVVLPRRREPGPVLAGRGAPAVEPVEGRLDVGSGMPTRWAARTKATRRSI